MPNATAKTSRAAVMIMLFSWIISDRLVPLVEVCDVAGDVICG
jgi:hypothetical protein